MTNGTFITNGHKLTGLRLLPRYPMRVDGNGVDLKRFVRVFRETWKGIPLSERRRLLSYWRSRSPTPYSPRFIILEGLYNRGEDIAALGVCYFHQNAFEFRADAVNLMPDNILRTLIAHELAHVAHRLHWRGHTPEDFRDHLNLVADDEPIPEGNGPNDLGSPHWMEEHETRQLHGDWGFCEEEFDEWLGENQDTLQAMKEAREAEFMAWYEAQQMHDSTT